MTNSLTSPPTQVTRLRLAVPAIVLVTILALGIFHGYWIHTWEQTADPAEITAKLHSLALSIGNWDGQDETGNLPEFPEGMIGPIMVRRYVNRKTGEVVQLLLTSGRPGPLVENHQPTYCYQGIGFELASGPTPCDVPLKDAGAEFMVGQFKKTDEAAPIYLRVFWSFSGSGLWQVPKWPRFTFARYRTLYKLYVVRRLRKLNEPMEGDPASEFIQELVPNLQKTIFAEL